mmetsp:Transcript_4265/g.9733  ORF Transcript_4265/g.9733 Transcript_4265/m.9733 type:complete len:264 (-) Transcript_4265:1025-1816(-)
MICPPRPVPVTISTQIRHTVPPSPPSAGVYVCMYVCINNGHTPPASHHRPRVRKTVTEKTDNSPHAKQAEEQQTRSFHVCEHKERASQCVLCDKKMSKSACPSVDGSLPTSQRVPHAHAGGEKSSERDRKGQVMSTQQTARHAERVREGRAQRGSQPASQRPQIPRTKKTCRRPWWVGRHGQHTTPSHTTGGRGRGDGWIMGWVIKKQTGTRTYVTTQILASHLLHWLHWRRDGRRLVMMAVPILNLMQACVRPADDDGVARG